MADTTTTAPISPDELAKERKTLWAILKEWLDNLLNDKKAVKLFGELKEQMQDMADAIDENANRNEEVLGEMVKLNQVMYDKIHDLDVSDNEYEQKLNELNDCVTKLLDVTEKIGKSQELAKEQVLNALKDIPDFAKANYELKVDYDNNPNHVLLINKAAVENSAIPDVVRVIPNMDGTISVDTMDMKDFKKEYADKDIRTISEDKIRDDEIAQHYGITDRPVNDIDRLIDMAGIQLKDALQCEQAIYKSQIEMYKRKKLNNELARKDYQNTLSVPAYENGKEYTEGDIKLVRNTKRFKGEIVHDKFTFTLGDCRVDFNVQATGDFTAKFIPKVGKGIEISDTVNGITTNKKMRDERPALTFKRVTNSIEFGDYHNVKYQQIIHSELFRNLLKQLYIDPDVVQEKMDNTYGRVAMIATVKKEHMDKVYKIEDILKKSNPGNIYRSENDTTYISSHIDGTDKNLIYDFDREGKIFGVMLQQANGEYKRIIDYSKQIVRPDLIDDDVKKSFNQIDKVFNTSWGIETEPMEKIYNKTVKENSRDKDTKSKDAKTNKLEGNKYINDEMMPIY
jgi:hypothetical protein